MKGKEMLSRTLVLVISLMILTPFYAYAGTATQTDWSGGDGIPGPVIDWGNQYYIATDINCNGNPSNAVLQKALLSPPLEHTVYGDFNGAYSVHSTDIDGDGDMDVLGAAIYASDISWWENDNGSGTSWTEHAIDEDFEGVSFVYAADIDGDGDMDVLGTTYLASEIIWWENDDGSGTSWTEHSVDGSYYDSQKLYTADIDGDGDIDVLGAAYIADDIAWWENSDTGSGIYWTEHTVDGDFNGPRSVYAADVDGDGDLDVLGAAQDADDITWWENDDGSGTSWSEHAVDASFDAAYSVYSSDIDGDGDMDVLGAAYNANDITWWENVNGSGTSWTEHTIDGNFDGARSVRTADIDEDGDMDVLGAALTADDITWWENDDGSGTSWTEHTLNDDLDGAVSACFADIDGDGSMDVLGAACYADDIAWWKVVEMASDGWIESSILDVQESPSWQTIDWTCTEPAGTSVAFQVRASDDSLNMGAWSDTLTGPCSLAGILSDEDSYFQYMAILNTTNPSSTPILHDVTVDWLPYTGIQEGSEAEEALFKLYGARPNPAIGHATLVFTLPVDTRAELTVYDLTGRMLHTVSDMYKLGVHEVILEDLASGVYLVRVIANDFTAAKHFVVVE